MDTTVSLAQARKALEDNQRLLDPEKHKIARNTNEALLHMLQGLERMSGDLDRLHKRIDPILKAIAEDYQLADEYVKNARR